jgi:hypothetical protein
LHLRGRRHAMPQLQPERRQYRTADAERFQNRIRQKGLASLAAGAGNVRLKIDPIPLPRGRKLVTLQDAGNYITKLPKAEHEAPEWRAAMESLLLVMELDGPTMFARIGIMRALNRSIERVFNPDRKDQHWGRRKLARER